MLIDCHTHVNSKFFKNNWKEVLERALEKNIWVINVGTAKDDSKENIDIASRYLKGVYAAVGQHPTEIPPATAKAGQAGGFDYDYFKNLAQNKKVVAIGECGLDYVDKTSDKEKQKEILKQHIKLAQEINKPLMLHTRTHEAYNNTLTILSGADNLPPIIFHFFSGTLKHAKKILEMNGCFTFGGVITFARDYDEVIKNIPLEKILLETDAPFVAPEPFRGKINEPAYIIETAKKMAEIKNVSFKEVAEITTQNAMKLFHIEN